MYARKRLLHALLASLVFAFAMPAWAGLSNTMAFLNFFTTPKDLGAATVGATATFNNALTSVVGTNTLTGLSISGEFRLVTTCVVGNNYAPGTNCTLNTQFAPVTPGAHTGTLTVSCTPTPVVGSVSLVCDGLPHSFTFLGTGLGGTTAAIPTLDRWAIMLLALLIMVWATTHLWRKQRNRR